MFEGTELPVKFAGEPVLVGDKFKFLPNGYIHTVVFVESTLRFLLNFETKKSKTNLTNFSSLWKHPEKWERV